MGYKYHQGSTPDEVDSTQSNPTYPHLGALSDSTKKAPVDTNRVKEDIFSDKVKKGLSQDIINNPRNSERVQDGESASKVVADNKKNVSNLSNSIKARNDTLDMARKGKIPAKP